MPTVEEIYRYLQTLAPLDLQIPRRETSVRS